MLKTMRGDSMELVCKLKNEGTPNAFRSEPVASVKDWSHLQAFDWRTLMCTQVCRVSHTVWKEKALAELKSRERSGLDSQRHEYRVPTVSGMFARILSRL